MDDYTTPNRSACALVTIDAQRDYFEPQSPVKSTGCTHCVEPIVRLVSAARDFGMPIFHMVRFYRPDGTNVDVCRRKAVEEGMRVLMPGSLGAELLSGVAPANAPRLDPHLLQDGGVQTIAPREEVIYKPRWGAFFGTPLELRLRNLGINTLIICGCNFTTAGRASVLEASERDFRIVLVPEAAGGLSEAAQCELARIDVHLMRLENSLNWLAGRHCSGKAA